MCVFGSYITAFVYKNKTCRFSQVLGTKDIQLFYAAAPAACFFKWYL